MRSAMNDARDREAERKCAARPDRCDLAELQAEAAFELGVEFVVGQRDDALGLALVLGPDDRRAMADVGVVLQRQDRERSGRQEMLLGAAVVIALVRDGGDDGGLVVAPAVARDAGLLADRRARAVGGDQQAGGHRAAIRELDVNVMRRPVPRVLPPPERGRVGVGVLESRSRKMIPTRSLRRRPPPFRGR